MVCIFSGRNNRSSLYFRAFMIITFILFTRSEVIVTYMVLLFKCNVNDSTHLFLCMVLGDFCYILTLRFVQRRQKPCLINFLGNTNLNTLGKKGTIKNLCLQTLQNVYGRIICTANPDINMLHQYVQQTYIFYGLKLDIFSFLPFQIFSCKFTFFYQRKSS